MARCNGEYLDHHDDWSCEHGYLGFFSELVVAEVHLLECIGINLGLSDDNLGVLATRISKEARCNIS